MNYTNEYQQPVQQPAQQPTQPNNVPQVQPNTATFIADKSTLDIINTVHPEMASAMINIAIKKFAETDDFKNYFVIPAFKEQVQELQNNIASTPNSTSTSTTSQPVTTPAASFNNW